MPHRNNNAKKDSSDAQRRSAGVSSAAEKVFDDLAWLAAHVCRAPMAVVSLVGDDGQRLKAKVGLTAQEASREFTICEDVLEQRGLLTVKDALQHDQLARNPLVIEKPGVRFLAGVPLVAADGAGVGTLLVMDRVPRELSPEQGYALEVLARQLANLLERQAPQGQLNR